MEGYGKKENGLFYVHLADFVFEGVIYFGEVTSLKRKKYSQSYVAHVKGTPYNQYVFYLPKGQKYKGEENVKITID